MTFILTSSGRIFDYRSPRPSMIDIGDIARGLSCESRFNGHTRAFYSVAQHATIASWLVPQPFALEALLHDASEAYLKDLPSPLKALCPDYRAIEARVDAAIRARFGLPPTPSREVKVVDLMMLATEKRDLMPACPMPWPCLDGIEPFRPVIVPWRPEDAEKAFLETFERLTRGCELVED